MKKFMKKYGFITLMLLGIVAGCIVGAAWPGATALEPFGTLFINMMFCVVVPMVFCSIASAIANMSSQNAPGASWASRSERSFPPLPSLRF